MARDEDIFRKLKKEQPLVKQRNLQPLSQRDFNPKSTFNIPIESPSGRRDKAGVSPRREPQLYSYEETPYSRPSVKKESPSELNLRRREPEEKRNLRKSDMEIDHEPRKDRAAAKPRRKTERDIELGYEPRKEKKNARPKREPGMFSGRAGTTPTPEEDEKLDVFMENVKPQNARVPERPAVQYEAQQDISAIEDAAPAKEMSLRHELKYYINYRDYVLLRSALKALMSPDPNADENSSYHVRSLYFDDVYETALREKLAGCEGRYKYRIRIYNFLDTPIKFEKKYKVGQYVGKESIDLTHGEYDSIMEGEIDFLKERDEKLAQELYVEMKTYLLRPRVIVDYMREAYVSPFENCRITFDKDLKAGITLSDIFDIQAPVMPMYDTGLMVLEVKFNRYLPEFIRRVLNNINAADRCAISKYVICRKYD